MEDRIDRNWLRAQLIRTGKTQRALAKALSIDPSAVSRLLEGQRQLKADEVHIVREFFESSANSENLSPGQIAPTRKVGRPPNLGTSTVLDLPVHTLTLISGSKYQLSRIPVEHRIRPPQLVGVRDAYAAILSADWPLEYYGKYPRYMRGEVIYVHPNKPVPYGGFAILLTFGNEGVEIVRVDFELAKQIRPERLHKIVLCASE